MTQPNPRSSPLPPHLPRRKPVPFGRIFVYVAIGVICACAIIPFLWMVSTSLKASTQIGEYPPRWIPDPLEWRNYQRVLTSEKTFFPLWTRNTLIIATLAVLGNTLASSLVAYGFSKINFKGRGVLFAIMLATMMIPFPVMMVSLFTIFRKIGDYTPLQMLGTLRPLWLPAWFGNAFSVFLLRQFYLTIPTELSEAARIDGCNDFAIYWRVILPLSRPALTVVALFTFMGVWRDFLGPLMYLQYPSQYTLSLGLQSFQSQHGSTPWNLLMAASVLVIAPVIVLFFMAQRTFIEGIATTGLKG